jgi:mannosyltransferase
MVDHMAGMRLNLPPNTGRSTWLPAVCALAIFILGFAARLHGIAAKPFWMDEITTLRRARLPFGNIVMNSLTFHQLPAYFIVTSWVLPFGHDEAWARSPAMVFGALSCVLAFGVARAAGGLAAGVAAGLLMALAPAMVQYGQEARSYTMLISAILVALWGLVLLAKDPDGAVRPGWTKEGKWGAWAAYTFGTAAALNILSAALFWFLAANLAAPVLAWRRRGFWRNWLLAQAVIVALSAPWFLAILAFGEHGAMGGLNWVPPLDAARLWWVLAGTYLFQATSLITVRVFHPGLPGIGGLVGVLVLGGVFALRRHGPVLMVLAVAVLVLPVCLLGISIVTPVLMPRYLLWSAAPFCICAGLGMTLLPRRTHGVAVAVLGLLLLVNLWPYYQDETKPRWDLAGQELRAGMQPGDLVLVDDPQAVSMMNIYLRRQKAPLPAPDWTESLTKAEAALSAGRRVWAVQGLVGQADHESQAQFLTRIAGLGAPALTEHAGLDIMLLRFDPSATAGRSADAGA